MRSIPQRNQHSVSCCCHAWGLSEGCDSNFPRKARIVLLRFLPHHQLNSIPFIPSQISYH
eukprot:scaffold428_cov168-Ochromonas_danica.AAC.12